MVWGGAIKLPREKSSGPTLQSDQQTIASISMARYLGRHSSDTYVLGVSASHLTELMANQSEEIKTDTVNSANYL